MNNELEMLTSASLWNVELEMNTLFRTAAFFRFTEVYVSSDAELNTVPYEWEKKLRS